jgi:hypothetical protein
MKTTISLIILSTLVFSGVSLAKDKMVKDPFGTRCKASELLEISSISEPKLFSEFPNAPPEAKTDKNKYVNIKFTWGKGLLANDELLLDEKESRKYKLKKGDKKYCLMSVDIVDW